MEKSPLYFFNARGSAKISLIDKVKKLFDQAGFAQFLKPNALVAIKIHWGEPGNTAYIPVPYIRAIVELVSATGAIPFVTDTCTLYSGMRHNAVLHLKAAAMNGFTAETLGAPVIIADGLRGVAVIDRKVDGGEIIKNAQIAAAISEAEAMIVVSHVKGHLLYGLAGAIKNLGMGCSAAPGKHVQHCDIKPRVSEKKCISCGLCIRYCPRQAISFNVRQKAEINSKACIGCGECVVICEHEAIPINWKTGEEILHKKTAEYAKAAVSDKAGKVGYFNFMLNITPDCDCCSWNDLPVVGDIGILAGQDPVALDKASFDMVSSRLGGIETFRNALGNTQKRYDDIKKNRYEGILNHAEKLGLGQQDFELIALDEPLRT